MLGITPTRVDFVQANGLAIHVGQRWTRRCALTLKSSEQPIDLTGYTGELEIADDYGGTQIVPVTVTIDGPNGIITLDMAVADTSQITLYDGVYELRLIDATSNPEPMYFGTVEVRPKVLP